MPARIAMIELDAPPAHVVTYGPAHSFKAGDALSEVAQRAIRTGKVSALKLPLASTVLPTFADKIRGENRRNVRDLPVRGLRASPDGLQLACGVPGADAPMVVGRPSATAWGHVADRLAAHGGTPGLRTYLPASPGVVREALVAGHAGMAPTSARVSMGLRGHDEIMRVAGPRYAPVNPDMVADALAAMCPGDWRGEVSYDRESWEIRLVDPAGMPLGAKVGDTFSRGITVRGNDVREGALEITPALERLKCSNGLCVAVEGSGRVRRHIGNLSAAIVQGMIHDELRALDRNVGRFAGAWADARQSTAFTGDAAAAFGALVDRGHLDAPGKRDDVVGALVTAWNVEPGYSRADVVNAVTRAAHDHGAWWQDMETAADVERQGSALVYVRGLTLA